MSLEPTYFCPVLVVCSRVVIQGHDLDDPAHYLNYLLNLGSCQRKRFRPLTFPRGQTPSTKGSRLRLRHLTEE